jgi:integrase
VRITQKVVEALKASPEQDLFRWDDQVEGFGVRIYPSGTKKFVVQWKRDGRNRRLVLGTYPMMKAEEARKAAITALAAVAEGHDPAAERDARKTSPTVAELCKRWLEIGTGPKGKPKRPSTLGMDRSRIEAHVVPILGNRKVRTITEEDVRELVDAIVSGRTASDQKLGPRTRRIVKGGSGVAARTLRMVKAIFAHAVREGLIPANPAQRVNVSDGAERERERYLSPEEMAKLGKALAAADTAGVAWQAVAAIRLILVTGLRKAEALGLRWDHIDFAHRRLVLPETKSGKSVRPLSRAAITILETIQGRASDTPWVFPATKGKGHYVGLQKAWAGIRAAAGLGDVHIHDLRHTVGANAAMSGASLLVVGRLLGHKKARSTERYAHLSPEFLADAADKVADVIGLSLSREKAAS